MLFGGSAASCLRRLTVETARHSSHSNLRAAAVQHCCTRFTASGSWQGADSTATEEQVTHPREYAIWKHLDTNGDGTVSRSEISHMCRKFDAMTHAAVLEQILDPEGKGYTDFETFCKGFKAVQMVRCAARLKNWHRTCGIGVAGNVAGHMAQAGEADASAPAAALPPGIFTFYAPHPHTVDAPEEEILTRLENFPVTNAVIDFPRVQGGDNVQVEPELGLYCDIVYTIDSKSVERLVPRRVAAFNDCSIRKLDGSTKLSERKNWGFGSKGISLRSFRIDSLSKGSYVDQLCLASYIRRGSEVHEYSIPAPARNYLLFHEPLLDWIVDRINNQEDSAAWEEMFPMLEQCDYPTSVWIALGAGEYTEWGENHFLQPMDESVVVVYDEKLHPNGVSKELVTEMFDDHSVPKGIIALHQVLV